MAFTISLLMVHREPGQPLVKKDGVVGGVVGSLGLSSPPRPDDACQTSKKLVRPRGHPTKYIESQGEEVVGGSIQGGIRNLFLPLSDASGADRESVRGVVQAACGGVGPNARV
jgi:hypothetical protein